jgi:hypothetical protein
MADFLAVIITIIIIAVPITGIAGFVFWIVERRRGESRSMTEAERQAHKAERQAQRDHDGRVGSARKEVSRAESAHARRVRDAEKALEQARTSPKLGAVWSTGATRFVLFEDRLQAPNGSHQLHPQVAASVETAGNLATKSRSTLTRMGVGTLVAGPFGLVAGAAARKSKEVDKRELYLLVDGGDWTAMGKFNPDKGARVREFAQALTLAARNAPAAAQRRAALVSQCQQVLAQAQADRVEIERTTAALQATEAAQPHSPRPMSA